MTDFSLKLSEDQIGIQSWVHGFAEDVVRPAAEEWDEKEETRGVSRIFLFSVPARM